MTLLDARHAAMIEGVYINAETQQVVATRNGVHPGTVCRVAQRFALELQVIIGPPDQWTPGTVRDVVRCLLYRAALARGDSPETIKPPDVAFLRTRASAQEVEVNDDAGDRRLLAAVLNDADDDEPAAGPPPK